MDPKSLSVALPNANPNESSIYRNKKVEGGLLPPVLQGNIRTVKELISSAVEKYGDLDWLGTRIKKQDGSLEPFKFKKLKEIFQLAKDLGSGLSSIGFKKGDRLGIYAKNCEQWLISEWATHLYGFIVVSLYDTLGAQAAEFIIAHSEISALVCSKEVYPRVIEACKNLVVNPIRHIITLQPIESKEEAISMGMTVLSFDDLLEMGRKEKLYDDVQVDPEDVLTIMYTSGTTGEPKGVMICHRNVIGTVVGFEANAESTRVGPNDVYLSYLPLAHIMERISLITNAYYGCVVGFYSGDHKNLIEDFKELKPTIIVGAPRVFQRMYDQIMNVINSTGGLKGWMFKKGYNSKKSALQQGKKPSSFWESVLFKKMNENVLGGRVRIIVSGSAPLSAQVHEFLRICFTPLVGEGYGLTESTSACSMTNPDFVRIGCCGPPLCSLEVKLVDVPERNYLHTDNPPRGELCIRGPSVFKGYYKNSEKTAEVLDEEGWLHTGDIAKMNSDGTITIVDRLKNIFKLAQGEYIAPEYLENVYCRAPLVAQCFVYGDSTQHQLVAVVVPDEMFVMKLGLQGTFAELCQDSKLVKQILDQMVEVAKDTKLQGFEIVKAIHLDNELWSVDNNVLTPTMKLKRHECLRKYRDVIDRLYETLNK